MSNKNLKQAIGYFISNGRLDHNDERKVVEGDTHYCAGPIRPCISGLHASPRPSQAAEYKSYLFKPSITEKIYISRVKLSGTVIAHRDDKWAASHRTYLKVIKLDPSLKPKISKMLSNTSQHSNLDRMIVAMLKD